MPDLQATSEEVDVDLDHVGPTDRCEQRVRPVAGAVGDQFRPRFSDHRVPP